MKRLSSLFLGLALAMQTVPAFAWQAHNWPGISSNQQPRTEAKAASQTSSAKAVSKPDAVNPITRGDFVKMFMDHLYEGEMPANCYQQLVYPRHPGYTLLFQDAGRDEYYSLQLCAAMRVGLVNGYRTGFFRPDEDILFSDAIKMVGRAYAFTPYPFMEPERTWYVPYMDEFARRDLIPANVSSAADTMTEADVVELLERVDGSYKVKKAAMMRRAEKPASMRW